jgi:hypothetical protein
MLPSFEDPCGRRGAKNRPKLNQSLWVSGPRSDLLIFELNDLIIKLNGYQSGPYASMFLNEILHVLKVRKAPAQLHSNGRNGDRDLQTAVRALGKLANLPVPNANFSR